VPFAALTIAVKFRESASPVSRLAVRTVLEELTELEVFTCKFTGLEVLEP